MYSKTKVYKFWNPITYQLKASRRKKKMMTILRQELKPKSPLNVERRRLNSRGGIKVAFVLITCTVVLHLLVSWHTHTVFYALCSKDYENLNFSMRKTINHSEQFTYVNCRQEPSVSIWTLTFLVKVQSLIWSGAVCEWTSTTTSTKWKSSWRKSSHHYYQDLLNQ